LIENVAAVQFDHRLMATLTALAALATLAAGLHFRSRLPGPALPAILCLAGAVALQYTLGVATLLSGVLIPVAVAHQAVAVLLLASALAVTHSLRGAR
jgi:cytochrome c oxidase assembly protein subunit 15